MTETNLKTLHSSLIGKRLVEAGFLTPEQVTKALDAQAETGLLFGEICLLHGWLTYDQLKQCLPRMRERLGEKLLARQLITMEQLWMALLEQRHTGVRLGKILVFRGWLDQAVLDEIASARRDK